MAAKKKAASAIDADKIIVAFALRDFSDGEGDGAINLTEGQRVELRHDDFEALAKREIVAKGIFVKVKVAVEGRRYSLKPHDTTWLPPHVYESWKGAGYCEPCADDPEVSAVLKAREESERDAVIARDGAVARCKDLEARLQEAGMQLQAARAQAVKLHDMINSDPDSGNVLDNERAALLVEITTLIDMFPECVNVMDDDGNQSQLDLQ